MRRLLASLIVFGSIFTTMQASADQLADIKAKGVLVCGTLGTTEPFSFTHPETRQLEGYDVDFCQSIAAGLGVKLELKQISVPARIPELIQGRVDILAAALGWTPERAQQIAYSDQYYLSLTKIASRHSDGFKDIYALPGKRISAPKGSTSEMAVKKVLPASPTMTFQDPPAAFLALQQSKVDGIALGELMLVKYKNQLTGKDSLDILEPEIMVEHWGLGMRKGETAFIDKVNEILGSMEKSGEATRIFDKWVGPNTLYKLQRTFTIKPIN
ncbi:ABC transporter substrate-binding protein [Dickeya dadantii]|uniref:ABC transporter substrate-binding protein n=1 Tax=Dickeya dadantii TaxID=204038 RepID=UPI001C0C0616|nr:ABC transporter substrate-binding protein [Dickeya dadantii]QWT41516.1 ABC transporter substrate-binding protein [Dickeya dadantii]